MTDRVPILAIETSQSNCGACVYCDYNEFYTMSVNFKYSHAEKIFEIIDYVIKSSRIKLNELRAIAVSSGPGSFTGLRIGISAAKGIGFGVSLPIIAVPTFEALAFQLATVLNDDTEFIIANRVNAEEIYLGKFKVRFNSYIFARDLQIVKRTDNFLLNDDSLVYGNIDFDGIPSERVKNIDSPNPEFIAKWAILFGSNKLIHNYDYLEPIYLKNFIVKGKVHD
jgi:tRNA threonylcarbamoyladenosine biosynthesis protein TsaB